MKVLYYDCFSGISGDMNLGAMIDLGISKEYLINELKKLNVNGYELDIKKDMRKDISGIKVDVNIMHTRDSHGSSHHSHRNLKDVEKILNSSSLSDKIKNTSLDIFMKIARAEAKIHARDLYDIHFHEVGALDSIIDIVGAAVCFDYFNVDKVMSSPVELGGGFVRCAHGIIPVPAPAALEILTGLPVKSGVVPFETTTPTGAAILASTVNEFTEKMNFRLINTGYGIGNRDLDIPNVLRVILGESPEIKVKEDCDRVDASLLECNIDDMNPEVYDYVIDMLFEYGAHDVFLTPIIMKKSRPAVKISVLCDLESIEKMKEILFMHTTTFGIRKCGVKKTMLKRDFSTVRTQYGDIPVKNAYYRNNKIKSKPEYEECKKLAKEHGVGIQEIYKSIT